MPVKVLFEASGVHAKKYAFKENQSIGVCVKSPDNPQSITRDESPERDHPSMRSL
jgi:hypothetical protein